MKSVIIPFLILLLLFVSCKEEVVEKPNNLIEKEKMVDIMYDLSLLGAMRNQNPVFLDSFKDKPNEYIYKKYKIDSLQFAQSNIYYAADFKEYKKMYEQVKLRLDKNKIAIESVIKSEKDKAVLKEKKKKKDSIKDTKTEVTKRTPLGL